MEKKLIRKYFGEKFIDQKTRLKSYNFIENFLEKNFQEYSTTKNTTKITDNFLLSLSKFSKEEFVFLLIHSGYIPDYYEHDSSEETLHTKLTETLIFYWAKLVGFTKSTLPTQKSSYEDITIADDNNIIVCDAKSFRLGRSQSAPNVKDVIKFSDYEKWLVKHGTKGVGGLITFPSLHDWQRGGDVYQYVSDPDKKVLLLFYEHISFFLILNYNSENLINLINDYPKLFKKKSKNKTNYWNQIIRNLFKDNSDDFNDFNQLAKLINQENVILKKKSLEKKILNSKDEIKSLFEKYKIIDKLINEITNTESNISENLFNNVKTIRQNKLSIDRITEFRIK